MSTRGNTAANKLVPLSDPKAILRAGNAERRCAALLQDQPIAPLLSHTSALLNSPSMADTGNNPNDRSADRNQTTDSSDLATTKDWFKKALKVQNASIIQAQEDRQQVIKDRRANHKLFLAAHQDNSNCISRLEDLLLAMNIKKKGDAQPVQTEPGRVDLQKFRTSNGLTYHRPFQEIEPFLRWIHKVQIFFGTKDVLNSADKIKIFGNLIAETNLQSFYANKATRFLTESWEEFKACLFDFALPTNWQSGLQRQVRKLEMSPTETFLNYSTRARTLQSLFNFDAIGSARLGNLQLAQFLAYSLPDKLQNRVNECQLLEVVPFAYGPLEKQLNASFLALQRPTKTPGPPRSTTNVAPSLACDEFVWRVHLYLDSQGLCHFCKKHCGSAAGACPGVVFQT
ncbi:hypothetical protein PCANC_20958 [Puccinia coronata f. sp. avenae]|uniref:Retrotransposon gag domain-containing protein n=1 Tax=Puccinia coronata f. sp. avenae TaxID=200324 RepID=A0A2N5UBL9_9BASI|nr:hypothetical protein PCANC_20958 [Puccinia coronata f. sp. avenae]